MLEGRPQEHELSGTHPHQEVSPLKVEYTEETSVRKSLSFEIEAEIVEREIEARAREYARKVKIPGFRPGKIPPEVIKKRFRQQVLEDVAETLVNRVVPEELQGRGLQPVGSPQVTDLKINENQPMTFRAVFETLPMIELPEYRGLSVKTRTPRVTDEDIDKELDRLREDHARYDPAEGRPAREGDFVVADIAWRPAEGGRGGRDENALVEVGSIENHKDLNAALVGMAPGETKEVGVTYEPDHPSKNLAGQQLNYTVTVKGLKEKVVPAADDEFAKDLGDFGSFEELRASVRSRLEAAEERRVDRETRAALVDALVEKAHFEVPEALVERHMTARTEGAARSLAVQGIDPTKVGMDWRRYREAQRDDSVKAAKADILLGEIARREGVEALDAEVDTEVARLAERLKKSKESLRLQMEKEGDLAALSARIREEKTLDLLKANARLDLE
jgi:trigger factor